MLKKAKKTPEQLEGEIEALIIKRFGKGVKFLLTAVESGTGFCNYFTNDTSYMFDYGAILFGRFCEDVVKDLHERANK